ncbi:MAG: hypothetical protein MZV70_67280 [Desulfobacterales bacterium]|nr:hypothetical protein [Desulfobacterales bacterium]
MAALENGFVPERYARNMRTFSLADQATLLKAHVGRGRPGRPGRHGDRDPGAHGRGPPDADRRGPLRGQQPQPPAAEHRRQPRPAQGRGRRASGSARSTRRSMCTAHAWFLTADNAPELLAGCDVVVDCLDNLRTRFDGGGRLPAASAARWSPRRWPAHPATSPPSFPKTAACA